MVVGKVELSDVGVETKTLRKSFEVGVSQIKTLKIGELAELMKITSSSLPLVHLARCSRGLRPRVEPDEALRKVSQLIVLEQQRTQSG